MEKHFNSTEITLGDYQKLVRGDKELPRWIKSPQEKSALFIPRYQYPK